MIEYRLLGPLEVLVSGRAIEIGGLKQRALLGILLLRANKPVPRDVLADQLWGDHAPPGAQHALEVYISRLRKAMDGAAGGQMLVTQSGTYQLRVDSEALDVHRFERLAGEGRSALACNAPGQAAAIFREALALWRGAPLADLHYEIFAQEEIARLEELRANVIEQRIDADLALGRHADVVSELGALITAHPLRERLRQQLMIALYRCGRQHEALAVYRSARQALVEELGIEPSPGLQRLERAILDQEASLQAPALDPPLQAAAQPRNRWAAAIGPHRGRLLVAGGLTVAVAVALLTAGGSSGSGRVPAEAGPDTVGIINGGRSILSGVVSDVESPNGVAYGEGATWVTDDASDLLLRISPARQVVDRIPVGRGPAGVAIGDGEVWVANEFDNTVSEVNPRTGTVVATIPVGIGPDSVVFGYGSVWVANVTGSTLSRIDPRSGRILANVALGSPPAGLAAGERGIWATSGQTGRLLLVDPRLDRVTRVIPAGVSPGGVTVGGGSVWVSDADGAVMRVAQPAGRIHLIRTGGSPSAVVYAARAVWVADGPGGSVMRIEPRTGSVRLVHVGNEPSALAAAGGDVLVTVLPSLASHRGGTLTLVGQVTRHDLPADPAVAWDPYVWQILPMTNDGLVGYRRAGGPQGNTLVPDLATALPVRANNGTTYTFHLRSGIRYSNGDPVRPEDFRHALERVFRLNHGGGPASAFYSGIAGADRCERLPQRCVLTQGIVTNDRAGTVTFHLTAPDPEFLDKLALPFADAVPARTPERLLSPAQIPATGPYLTRSLRPRSSWILVRNPRFHQWSAQAQPGGYPDQIVLRLGVAPGPALDAVEHGRADVLITPPPLNRIHELATRYASLLHTDPLAGTFAIFMNTRVWPFSVLAARRAVDYAIDRNKMIGLAGGPLSAQPTCQILPPAMPGYRPYCPYTINPGPGGAWEAPNLARAEQLARASGTRGAKVTVMANGFRSAIPARPTGRYLVSVLRKLGYRASLRVINRGTYYQYVGDSRNKAQVGEFSWYQDFPAASDFIDPLFTCRSFLPGTSANINDSQFCSRRIDAQAAQALALQAGNPGAAASLWARIDHEIVDEAPWAPIYNPRDLVVLAPRVGNYQFHPLWSLLIDQLWVR